MLKSCQAYCGSTTARSARNSIELTNSAKVPSYRLITDLHWPTGWRVRCRKRASGKGLVDRPHPLHVDGVGRALLHRHQRIDLRHQLLVDRGDAAVLPRRAPVLGHAHAVHRLLAGVDLGDRAQQAVPGLGIAAHLVGAADPHLAEDLDVEQAQLGQAEGLRMLAEHRVHQRGVGPRRGEQEHAARPWLGPPPPRARPGDAHGTATWKVPLARVVERADRRSPAGGVCRTKMSALSLRRLPTIIANGPALEIRCSPAWSLVVRAEHRVRDVGGVEHHRHPVAGVRRPEQRAPGEAGRLLQADPQLLRARRARSGR